MNKSQKEQFVQDVLKSLKVVDYIEMARLLLVKDAESKLPDDLKNYIDYLETTYVNIYGASCMSVRVRNNRYVASEEIKSQVKSMHDLHIEQKQKLKSMEIEIYQLIKNCNTLKKAKEILPEKLHKFLPPEAEKSSTSTAIVSDNLIKSLEVMGLKQ